VNGNHKVTVSVELTDGTVMQKVETFSSGNPRYHAKEFAFAAGKASFFVETVISGMYGDIRDKAVAA
jgi:hypothetical protein